MADLSNVRGQGLRDYLTNLISGDGATGENIVDLSIHGIDIAANTITSDKLTAINKQRFMTYRVEDMAADGDISGRVLMQVPTGQKITINSALVVGDAAASGIDNSNTSVIALTDGTNTLVTKTYNAGTAFPAANTPQSLGTISDTYKTLSAGKNLVLNVTNGSAANLPAFSLLIGYIVDEA